MSFKILEAIATDLQSEYPENLAWATSSLAWIRTLPPASKGTVGRNIASGLLQSCGLTVSASKQTLRVNGRRISVKTSLMWEAGLVKFQNIRNSKSDLLLCLGLYPGKSYGWLIPEGEIWLNGAIRMDRPGVTQQHKGADAWLEVHPEDPPTWLETYGGTTDELMKVARSSL